MKVQFGCGKKVRSGWVNVDVQDLPGVDVIANFWDAGFPEASVSDIYCRHALEHCSLSESRKTLRAWHDCLEPNGQLELIVPDLEFHARLILGQIESKHRKGGILHALAGLYGWQDGGDESYHRTGWTREFLDNELRDAGLDPKEWKADDPSSLWVIAGK